PVREHLRTIGGLPYEVSTLREKCRRDAIRWWSNWVGPRLRARKPPERRIVEAQRLQDYRELRIVAKVVREPGVLERQGVREHALHPQLPEQIFPDDPLPGGH